VSFFFVRWLGLEVVIWGLICGVRVSVCECGSECFASEHVDHSFQVVDGGGQADFRLRSGQSAQQQAGVAEDVVLQGGEGVFDCRSSEPHGFRRSPFVHPLQGVVVKVTADGPPGSCGALAFERAAGAVFGRGGVENAGPCCVPGMTGERGPVGAAEGIGGFLVHELAAVQQRAVSLAVDVALGRNVRQDALLFAALGLFAVRVPLVGHDLQLTAWNFDPSIATHSPRTRPTERAKRTNSAPPSVTPSRCRRRNSAIDL
jgi:hypothetical protein